MVMKNKYKYKYKYTSHLSGFLPEFKSFKDNLKEEINFRYNIVQYKKLMKNYILNRMEKNNLLVIYSAIEDLKVRKEN